MDKICLITYCNSPNYGAALQLYATYKKIRKLGYSVEVLNYKNKFESSHESLKFVFSNAPIKEKIRYFFASFVFGGARNGKRNFESFYKKLNYSPTITSVSELKKMEEYSVFCVGSDQVWNPLITNGFDDVFILNSKLPRKISYASSMGSLNFHGYDVDKLYSALESFDYISVREQIALDYLASHIKKNVTQVVDPTLLYGRKEWDEELKNNNVGPLIKERYVLVYALGGYFEKNNEIAQRIANQIGAKVAAITLSNRPRKVDYLLNKVTPLEFVELIKNAEFVVTNSFHGTCFSIMYETPFYSVKFGDNPARSEELLAKYGLIERLFKDGDSIDFRLLGKDDITTACSLIENDVNRSELWLAGALNG